MNNKYYYLLLIPIISFVVVVAAGFWYVSKDAQTDNQNTSLSGEQPYIHPVEAKDPNSYEAKIDKLKQAVKSFRNAKSFTAVLEESSDEGDFHSEISYVKPLRMQAKLKINNDTEIEIIIVGETAYARYSDQDWKITNDTIIRKFGRTFFETMLASSEGLDSLGIPNDAEFDIRNDAINECENYSTMYELEGEYYPISLCVNENNELVKISKSSDNSETVTSFNDFNTFFSIERPMLPLLERTMTFEKIENNQLNN